MTPDASCLSHTSRDKQSGDADAAVVGLKADLSKKAKWERASKGTPVREAKKTGRTLGAALAPKVEPQGGRGGDGVNTTLTDRWLDRDTALRRWEVSLHEAAHLLAAVLLLRRRFATAVLLQAGDGGVSWTGGGHGWRRAVVAAVGDTAEKVLTWMHPPPGPVPDLDDEVGQSGAAARLRRLWNAAQRNPAERIRSDRALVAAHSTCDAREEAIKKYAKRFVLRHQHRIQTLAKVLYNVGEVSVLRSDNGCLEITT